MNGIEKANKATTTPTIPQIKNLRAVATSSGLPWAVANLNAAKMNMTMKKAMAIGHKMLKRTSMRVFTLRFGRVAGVGPGLKANRTPGTSNAADNVETSNFLFIVLK